jgi:hypothetical protein
MCGVVTQRKRVRGPVGVTCGNTRLRLTLRLCVNGELSLRERVPRRDCRETVEKQPPCISPIMLVSSEFELPISISYAPVYVAYLKKDELVTACPSSRLGLVYTSGTTPAFWHGLSPHL